MEGGLLSLKWNNHKSTFFQVLSNVRKKKESYADVTLACDGKFYPVHKLVLSSCSEYFEQMFEQAQCKHPFIVLKDIRHEELESLLSYMYVGEVNVVQEKLSGLIKAAECLRIKGLAVPDEEPPPSKPSGAREKRSSDNSISSEPKRRRQEDSNAASTNRHLSSRNEGRRRSSSDQSPNNTRSNKIISSSKDLDNNSNRENRWSSPPNEMDIKAEDVDDREENVMVKQEIDTVILEPDVVESNANDDLSKFKQSSDDLSFTMDQNESNSYLMGDNEGEESVNSVSEGNNQEQPMAMRLLFSQAQNDSLSAMAALCPPLASSGANLLQHESTLFHITNNPPTGGATLDGSLDLPDDNLLGAALLNNTPDGASLHTGTGGSGNPLPSFDQLNMADLVLPSKQYRCPVCPKVSADKAQFRRHYYTHSGEKPYSCPLCTYRGIRKCDIKYHMLSKHKNWLEESSDTQT